MMMVVIFLGRSPNWAVSNKLISIYLDIPMGTGRGPVTDLLAGSNVTVSWKLTAVFLGGFKIQLLAPNGTILDYLTRNGTEYLGSFVDLRTLFTQSYEITLPNYECTNCALRLLRQAYFAKDMIVVFWTCADVNIKSQQSFVQNCSNHGRLEGSDCQCDALYSGAFCQYQDECWEDSDCNNNGKCIDRKTASFPKKVCYCNPGWHGTKCERVSSMTRIPTDEEFVKYYNYAEMRPKNVELFWRLDKEKSEIEIIFKVRTTSWVGIGWRPKGILVNATCLSFPSTPNATEIPIDDEGNVQTTVVPHDYLDDDMACSDIVIGYVQGSLSHIHDYYCSVGFPTPRPDIVFGGVDDLVAAVGVEKDGFTYLGYRKKMRKGNQADPTDHSIFNETMHVIWARGPQYDDGPYEDQPFYAPLFNDDDLLYHRNEYLFRGATDLSFFHEANYNGSGQAVVDDPDEKELGSPTQPDWQLMVDLTFGILGTLVGVKVLILCFKMDANRREKERQKEVPESTDL